MENKIETPLQRLIAELNISIEYFKNSLDIQTNEIDRGRSKLRLSAIQNIKTKAENLLPYEREVIENAYWEGGQDIPTTEMRCKEYFEKTFQTNE